MHLLPDDLCQPFVARQAEHIVDMILLAPAHQFFAAEARVGAEHDLHPRPALPQLRHDATDLFDRTLGSILIGRPQPAGCDAMYRSANRRSIDSVE